jgi:hypothetical protein
LPIATLVLYRKQKKQKRLEQEKLLNHQEELARIKVQLDAVLSKVARILETKKISYFNVINQHKVKMHAKLFKKGSSLTLANFQKNENDFADYYFDEIYTYFLDSFILASNTFLSEESSREEDDFAIEKLSQMFALIAREYDESHILAEVKQHDFESKISEKSKQTLEQEFKIDRTVYLKNKRGNDVEK